MVQSAAVTTPKDDSSDDGFPLIGIILIIAGVCVLAGGIAFMAHSKLNSSGSLTYQDFTQHSQVLSRIEAADKDLHSYYDNYDTYAGNVDNMGNQGGSNEMRSISSPGNYQ